MAGKRGALAELDLSLKLTPKEEQVRIAAAQERLLQLRLVLGGLIEKDPQIGPPVCVVFEGWDAAGKGGAIKRLTGQIDPRGYVVWPIAAPSDDDRDHHYLWRFWRPLARWRGDRDLRPLLVRPRPGRARRGVRDRGRMAPRVPRDQPVRTAARRVRHDRGEILAPDQSEGTAPALQGARTHRLQGVEADRRGLAQSRKMGGLRDRGGGDAAADRPHRTPPGPWSRPTTSGGPG